jgi:choline dehydrogenase-like flavoprotein
MLVGQGTLHASEEVIAVAETLGAGVARALLGKAALPGAQDVLAIDRYAHLVGGCRMGTDPDRSVVNADHRAWGVPNLFIADGSVMPTQGSANPAITIMALASRLAERLDLKRIDGPSTWRPQPRRLPRLPRLRPALSRSGGD